jgi:pyruvate formate lyase activating enzyme
VPLHFTAFHPDWKMRDKAHTPAATLTNARQIAIDNGLHYVYTGNVHDAQGASTYCPNCRARVIERDWYVLGNWAINERGACNHCGNRIAGHFANVPGSWGARRLPVRIGDNTELSPT